MRKIFLKPKNEGARTALKWMGKTWEVREISDKPGKNKTDEPGPWLKIMNKTGPTMWINGTDENYDIYENEWDHEPMKL